MGSASKRSGQWFECNYCGEEFYKSPSQIAGGETKHCSLECRHKNNQVWRECPNCKQDFRTYPCEIENGRGKYCSQECRNEYSKDTVECHQCGAPTTKYKHYLKKVERTFCSNDCRKEWHKTRTAEDAPAWNGGYGYKGKNWSRMRKAIRKKYNGKCAVCGADETKHGSKPDVHHITPIREFDTPEDANTEDNLILLCRGHHGKVEGWNLIPSDAT